MKFIAMPTILALINMHKIHKYQFYISFNEKLNTAASKATQDCRSVLSNAGYEDCSIEDLLPSDKYFRFKLIRRLTQFFFKIKPGSIVAIQYPLLSGNDEFRYFIKGARLKKVKFFCIIHDINELRYQEPSGNEIKRSSSNLNYYDCIIAHNQQMAIG